MPTDIEFVEREDRLASVSESGVSVVTKERLAQLQAQLDEDRHLLEQERAIQAGHRKAFARERAELDEKIETIAIESERQRERARELDQRESALKQREATLAKRASEVTNPRLDAKSSSRGGARASGGTQMWNLPTVAASIQDMIAMVKKLPRREPAEEPVPEGGELSQVMVANPIATFAFGFVVAMIAMILLLSFL